MTEREQSISISSKLIELSETGGDIRRMFMEGQKLKAQNPGLSLIDLSLGNPDLEPPPAFQEAMESILGQQSKGSHRYMDAAGLLEVRQFLANELSQSESAPVSENSVYLTVGAAGGLQILLRTFLDEKDEVILFSPYFPEYVSYVQNFNAVPQIVSCDENHQPKMDDFKKALTKKTKIVVLNSPNNPTGVIYHDEIIRKICEILDSHHKETGNRVHLISDEPYARIAYKGKKQSNILNMYDFSWIVRSFSKDLGLAGERIGFIFWRSDLPKNFQSISDHFRSAARILGFVNAPRLMQRLLPFLFNHKIDPSIYEARVHLFIKELNKAGISCVQPSAGFFVFPKSPISDDRKFCEMLLKEGVLCVPGSGFGTPGYFRASLVQEQSWIGMAAQRICKLKNRIKSIS